MNKSRQIELSAVNTITGIFNACERLSPYIANGDREPVWDGYIYLSNLKNECTGKIPVQVKGQTFKKAIPNKPTYSVSLTNLQAYKRDGGCVYFVVYIKDEETYPYYAKLAPIDLKRYIKNASGKQTTSIKLYPLTNRKESLEREFLDFWGDCKMQTSFADAPILSIEEAIKRRYKINCKAFNAANASRGDLLNFCKTPMYLYAELGSKGLNVLYPIGEQAFTILPAAHIVKGVSINGNIYFNEYVSYICDTYHRIVIGNCVTLTINLTEKDSKKSTIKYKSNETVISKKINELKFVKELQVYKSIDLGDSHIAFNSLSVSNIDEIDELIVNLEKMQTLFGILKIGDVDTKDFTDEDFEHIDYLVKAIVDKQPVAEHQATVATVSISKYEALLLSYKQKDGKFIIKEFFDGAKKLAFSYKDNEHDKGFLMTSPYTVIFNRTDCDKLSNIDYSGMIPSYEDAAKHNPYITERANKDMLMALMRYDESSKKDERLYDAIVILNEWLMRKSMDGDEAIHLINKYQIIKRKRRLTKEEKKELRELPDKFNAKRNDVMTAISLLLDNESDAEYYYDNMSEHERKFFDSLPIHYFMTN